MANPQLPNEEFLKANYILKFTIDGKEYTIDPRTFTTGSVGYAKQGKLNIDINGKAILVQFGINVTVIGSKPETSRNRSASQTRELGDNHANWGKQPSP